MDVHVITCPATLHPVVDISPHVVTEFTLDYDLFFAGWGFVQGALPWSRLQLSLWDMCLWKCLLPISPLMRVIRYVSFICEEDYSVLAYNPFSGLNTPPHIYSLLPRPKLWTCGFPSACENLPTIQYPPLQWRWGTLFYSMICLVCPGQILFLRLAYTFLLQMVYIPRQGAVLNQLAAPCSWDKVETLSSVRSTGD